jgi:potassium-transporting ATPase KdpC subunit
MLTHLRPALVLMALLTLITGLAYPLAVTGIAQLAFPHEANGSLIESDGTIIGSRLIGQSFTAARYFHGRPSATTPPYNAAASSGSNLGPASSALVERVTGDLARRRAENPAMPVPVDLVTSSASGLDPHISPAAAAFQIPRIAQARNLPAARIEALIAAQTNPRLLGLFGEATVNVLTLNRALDAATAP